MTVAMFNALEALVTEVPDHGHECGHECGHDDVCDEDCCIAVAVIPGEGTE